jgi:hypothetical protein
LKFGPNQNLTKSEAIVSLVNGWELKAGNPDSLKVYSDRSVISTPLASSGVKSNQQSILNYPSVFRPLLQQSTVNNNSGATGIDMIPNFAVSAIATASDLNIVVNYPARDRRSPLRHITRAEISALIYQTLVAINPAKAIDSPYSGSIAW